MIVYYGHRSTQLIAILTPLSIEDDYLKMMMRGDALIHLVNSQVRKARTQSY
ncbi:unnamed protein product [Toxocara canis]|uniref:Transposase n=1 Tax=Toxocara canis TaxID=6265 RepID=A0A183VHK7_TOXCA|nr:unnamed protein product [Toxocara canis]